MKVDSFVPLLVAPGLIRSASHVIIMVGFVIPFSVS